MGRLRRHTVLGLSTYIDLGQKDEEFWLFVRRSRIIGRVRLYDSGVSRIEFIQTTGSSRGSYSITFAQYASETYLEREVLASQRNEERQQGMADLEDIPSDLRDWLRED